MGAVRGFFAGVFCFLLSIVLVLLGIIISLNMTVLNADFVTDELEKLDVYPLIIEQAKTMLPSQPYIDAKTVDELATELTPWFEEQADTVIHAVYAYVKEGQNLNVNIALEPVRAAVKAKIEETTLSSLPPQLQGASQSQIDAYMSQRYSGIDNAVPLNFELNQAVLGSAVMASLEPIKHIVGYIKIAYIVSITAAILLILLVALAHWWRPKAITLSIGITFMLVGLVCILGPLLNYLITQLIDQAIGSFGILSGLQTKLSQLASDLTAPVRTYGIGFLISGIALIVISVLYRSPQRNPDTVQG